MSIVLQLLRNTLIFAFERLKYQRITHVDTRKGAHEIETCLYANKYLALKRIPVIFNVGTPTGVMSGDVSYVKIIYE